VRSAIEDLELVVEGARVPITVSAGVVEWKLGESLGTVVKRADHALYRAKSAGRNRVIQVGPNSAPPPSS
jgi:diguanylate cyclase